MCIARHHAEWLSLVEASGSFLNLPILVKAFPSGLNAHEPEQLKVLRLAKNCRILTMEYVLTKPFIELG
ncbi:hypothetical protein [Coleofasciculus sp. G2-EDA-02]|uniref:hypothetical protein n=1 Tax=Coleofasciculus sp. G2-EDA-02 TaxID=3069529 RepID=UPI0033014458